MQNGKTKFEGDYSGYDIAIIEANRLCQFRCPGCYILSQPLSTNKEMSLDEAKRIIDLSREYKGSDIKEAQIVGGEPTIKRYQDTLKKFIGFLKDRGIDVQLYTNMYDIDEQLAEWLFKNDVMITGKLSVSPNGGEEAVRVQAAALGTSEELAKRMIGKIKLLQEAGYTGHSLRLNNFIRRDNLPYAAEFYKWCLENNITADFELMSSGCGVTEQYYKIAPTPEEIAELIKSLQQIRTEMELSIEKIGMPHLFNGCRYHQYQLYFDVDGNIKICSTDNLPILARIDGPEAIKKARESGVVRARNNLSQENVNEPCNECGDWDNCGGGCRATSEGEGDLNAGYPICPKPYMD